MHRFEDKKAVFRTWAYYNDTLHFRSNAIKTSPIDSIKRQLMYIYKYMGYALKSPSFLKEMSELFQVYIKGKFDLLQFDHYFLLSQRSFVVFKRIFINVEENFTIVGYPILQMIFKKTTFRCKIIKRE